MQRLQKGLCSTCKKDARKREVAATRKAREEGKPNESHEANNLFFFWALADTQTGTMYTDQTGALPVRLLDGMQYFFIAYDYTTNFIFTKPIDDLEHKLIITACEPVFDEQEQ